MTNLNEDKPKHAETGFAKFLASRRPHGEAKSEKVPETIPAGLGESKEVERDGYGAWSIIRMNADGMGVGVGDGAIDVSLSEGVPDESG